MSKAIFLPVSVGGGLLAGLLGKRLFNLLWGVVDGQEPAKAEHRQANVPRLAVALLVEGAVFALLRGLVDHRSRHVFARVTGAWPGDEEPDAR